MSVEESINSFIDTVEKLYDLGLDGADGFTKEFQKIKYFTASLKKDPSYSTSAGESEENKKRNRYKDILPYDRTRVRIPLALDNETDYVNASLIKGPDPGQSYIASQGPLPHTVSDFWKMLWAMNVRTIIMVCREMELGKRKCERYWASDENECRKFDDITVTLESQEKSSGFCKRHIVAHKGQERRKITQLQLVTWPDHGVPRTRQEILNMITAARCIQGYDQDPRYPLCVHCSAGCGRTGAVLVIDYFRNLLYKKKLPINLSVFDVVIEMRKQRPAIVQTKDQYEFVHLAISEMFTKYLKDVGGKEPMSQLSKSLLSTNYENVTLPSSAPPKPNQAKQNYENIEISDKPTSLEQGSKVMPPPKPGREVIKKPATHARPVSTFELRQLADLHPPTTTPRKQSHPNITPPKPLFPKKPSKGRESPNVKPSNNVHKVPPQAPSPAAKPKPHPRPRADNMGIPLTDFTAKQDAISSGVIPKTAPVKPRRTFRNSRNPANRANSLDGENDSQSDVYSFAHKDGRAALAPHVQPSTPYYSVPPSDHDTDEECKARSCTYAEINTAAQRSSHKETSPKSRNDPPNMKQLFNAPLIPERTPDSYILADDVPAGPTPPASLPYEDLSELRLGNENPGRRTSGASSLAGVKAKAKDMFGKTTTVFNAKVVALQNFTSTRPIEDDGYNPQSRVPTYKPGPVIYNNKDVGYGHRIPGKPKGPRPTPSKWNK